MAAALLISDTTTIIVMLSFIACSSSRFGVSDVATGWVRIREQVARPPTITAERDQTNLAVHQYLQRYVWDRT